MIRECPTVNCLGSLASRILARKRDLLAFLHVFDWIPSAVSPRVSVGFMSTNQLAIQIVPLRRITREMGLRLLSGVIPELLDSHLLKVGGIEGTEDWIVEGHHERLTFESLES